MAPPVSIIGFPNGMRVQRFEMVEFEVKFGKDFHLSEIGERNYHNAYDADENFTLFRADAIFQQVGVQKTPYVVPVFAARGIKLSFQKPSPKQSEWCWYVRFRPPETGAWRLRIRVLAWHPNKAPHDPKQVQNGKYPPAQTFQPFYEHKFGFQEEDYRKFKPYAERVFTVHDDAKLSGPLESPGKDDNPKYFYRWQANGSTSTRRPYFLLGLARPWDSEKKTKFDPDDPWSFYSHLDRETELFKPMQKVGCNALLHWMAPWEGLLVHQSCDEHWPQPEGKLPRGPSAPYQFETFARVETPRLKQPYSTNRKLAGSDTELGYKRYDQGRALHLDGILDLAHRYGILLFLVVMPHDLLRDCDHPWGGVYFGKGDEKGYCQEFCKEEKYWKARRPCGEKPERRKHPSQLNGFQLFKKDSRETIAIEDFFAMDPDSKEPWQRQLWKHYANFWRYVVGRWTAHPALGAWILVDEMDGVGAGENWWWNKKAITHSWHNHVLKLLRKLMWTPPEGWQWQAPDWWKDEAPCYVGDYLRHPVTSSATDYEGTYWKQRADILKRVSPRKAEAREETTTELEALLMINELGELPDHGDWRGAAEKLDFVSHHAYHMVPTWGEWLKGKYRDRKLGFTGWHKVNTGNWFDRNEGCKQKGARNINTDRWLWDALCMRLHKWTQAHSQPQHACPQLITEYGCWERGWEKQKPIEPYGSYGKRYPSYAHFANWAALMLGQAGIPFKWNDGKELGEMGPREGGGSIWSKTNYPVDNYGQIESIHGFVESLSHMQIPLGSLRHRLNLQVKAGNVDEQGQVVPAPGAGKNIPHFNAWALATPSRSVVAVWVYDRTFSINGKAVPRFLEVRPGKGTYEVWWYDTWNGGFDPGEGKRLPTAEGGLLNVPLLNKFFLSDDPNVTGVADGNDVAVLIIRRDGGS